MGCEKFNVGSIRNHRDGIHMPDVRWEPNVPKPVLLEIDGRQVKVDLPITVLGELVMFGRRIPVISPEQLAKRLDQIGVRKDIAEQIVGELFGFAVATEASVSALELDEALV